MESRARASTEQFATLLEFMERHGDIARPQAAAQGRVRADRLWQELECLLNSVGSGDQKPLAKWKKVWADWKTKTKKKSLLIRRHASRTGGGPHSGQTLNSLELRVLNILGHSAVTGQDDIAERGLTNSQTAEESQSIVFPPHIQERQLSESGHLDDTPANEVFLPPLSPQPGPSTAPLAAPPSAVVAAAAAQAPAPGTAPRSATPAGPAPRQPPSSPPSSASTRRRTLRVRQRRTLTPFDRAAKEFVAVEQRRLQLEEMRERNLHERETERLRLESLRIEAFRRFTDVTESLLRFFTNRDDTVPLDQTEDAR